MTFRLVFVRFFFTLLLACGSGTSGSPSSSIGGSDQGDSAPGGSTATGGTNLGGAGSGGGSSEVCHPPVESLECQSAKFCECLPTYSHDPQGCETLGREYPCDKGTNTPEWCALIDEDACPEGSNVCTPGSANKCGYDLPPGKVYSEPKCKEKINGDMWSDGDYDGPTSPVINANGQYRVGFWSYSVNVPYFNGFLASGEKLYWNRANAAVAYSAEGVFADDCETITFYLYLPGETTPQPSPDEIYWMHD